LKELAEEIAKRFYEAREDLKFRRITFSKTSLKPAAWKDCNERERLEWIEAAKRVLADQEIMQMLTNRAAGM